MDWYLNRWKSLLEGEIPELEKEPCKIMSYSESSPVQVNFIQKEEIYLGEPLFHNF